MDTRLLGEAKVDLCDAKLSITKAKGLAKEIAADKRTTELLMAENECGIEGLLAIAAAFEKNSTIENLSLIISDANADVAKTLAHSLTKNTALRRLVLDVNKIGAEGAAALGKALEKNHALQLLSLNQNELGPKGAAGLAAGLLKNATLQELHLNENKIGSEGATALARSIGKVTSLTTLSLEENGIGPDGAAALASLLTATPLPSLLHLSLRDNSLGEDGGLVLMKAIEVNTRIKTLRIESNGVSERVRERIAAVLKREGLPPPLAKIPITVATTPPTPSALDTRPPPSPAAAPPVAQPPPSPSGAQPRAVEAVAETAKLERKPSSERLKSSHGHKRSPSGGAASPMKPRSNSHSARKGSGGSEVRDKKPEEKKPSSARGLLQTSRSSSSIPRSTSEEGDEKDERRERPEGRERRDPERKEKKKSSSSRTASPAPAVPSAQPSVPIAIPDRLAAGVLKQGWLRKVGSNGSKRYWFALHAAGADGPELSWAEAEDGARKGTVVLRSALISVPKAPPTHAAPASPAPAPAPAGAPAAESHTILVRPAHGAHTKPLFVAAASRPELVQWLDQLLAAAHRDSP